MDGDLKKKTVAVIGVGAIGGWIACRLNGDTCDVTVVARGAQFAGIDAAGGITLQSHQTGETHHPMRVVHESDTATLGPQDVVFLAMKAHQIAEALPCLLPLITPSTIIVPLINGIPWWLRAEPIVSVDPGGTLLAALPRASIVGTVVYSSGNIVSPGIVAHTAHGKLLLGSPPPLDSAPALDSRPHDVAALFAGTPIVVEVVSNIACHIYTKLMGNTSLNLLCALSCASSKQVLDSPALRAAVERIMAEVSEIAAADGSPCCVSVPERLKVSLALGTAFRPSTLQDVDAGRPTEIEAIGGALVEIADSVKPVLEISTIRMIVAMMRLRDASLRGPGL